jgi:hypothetical protein
MRIARSNQETYDETFEIVGLRSSNVIDPNINIDTRSCGRLMNLISCSTILSLIASIPNMTYARRSGGH